MSNLKQSPEVVTPMIGNAMQSRNVCMGYMMDYYDSSLNF